MWHAVVFGWTVAAEAVAMPAVVRTRALRPREIVRRRVFLMVGSFLEGGPVRHRPVRGLRGHMGLSRPVVLRHLSVPQSMVGHRSHLWTAFKPAP
ncbi:hypothetical protein GCM10009738_87610 [Kitasatospora viridis]|uniref:Uncharacterized protein n=1 Tax=Kitasatospora viridis TaxID=281105 RepID=A0A561SES5_9ACTN|nr:hypothetical protein FHX73_16515 [Kitasatospora viridis]